MAQNGFRNTSTRNYPGTASRLMGASPTHLGASSATGPQPPPLSTRNNNNNINSSSNNTNNGSMGTGSEPTVFIRPLSRSQLTPAHIGDRGGGGGGSRGSTAIATTVLSGTVGSGLTPTSPTRPISLDQPRPNSERNRNLYLGAPILQQHQQQHQQQQQITQQNHHNHHHHHLQQNQNQNQHHPNLQSNLNQHHQHHSGATLNINSSSTLSNSNNNSNVKISRVDSSVTAAEQVRLPTNSRKKLNDHSNNSSNSTIATKNNNFSDNNTSNSHVSGDAVHVVTTQPTKRSLFSSNISDSSSSSDENINHLGGGGGGGNGGLGKPVKLPESSIVCPYCRKCRCQACASPRPLPSRWICSKSVQCGPEPVLDYLTCLCCVKAIFYHCGKNFESDDVVICADKPCSCVPHRRVWRWGCMTAMSLFLPCLCLYWPCKGCIHVAEKTYQKYHNNGCTCRSSSSSSTSNNNGLGGGGGGGISGLGGISSSSNLRRDGLAIGGMGGQLADIFPEDEDHHASSHFSHPNVMMTTANSRSNKLLSSD